MSPTTVSHALNGKGHVNPDTIARVKSLADQLGYRPSPLGTGLQSSKLGIIGLAIRPLHSLDTSLPEGVDYFMRLAGAAALQAMDLGYSMMLVPDPASADAPPSTLAADAYVVADPFEEDPVLTLLTEQRIPFITIGPDPARREKFHHIFEDSTPEIELIVAHLEAAGAQRIAFVTGTDSNSWNLDAKAAIECLVEAKDYPLMMLEVPEVEGMDAGEFIFTEFERQFPDAFPDAIYCLTGRHAAGVLESAQRRDIDVPGDLMIVSGSDAEQNRVSQPTITALELHPEKVARQAVTLAVQLAEGRKVPMRSRGPLATLKARESTNRSSAR